MSCVNMTIPLDDQDAEALINEAKRQGRSFSGYIQKLLNNHLETNSLVVTKQKPVRKKRVVIRRKK